MTNLERNHLKHHGILGQKWGVRRYQNEDGTLTDAGKQRYSKSDSSLKNAEKHGKNALDEYEQINRKYEKLYVDAIDSQDVDKINKLQSNYDEEVYEKVTKPLYDLGYEFVNLGGGYINGKEYKEISFGKYMTDEQWDEYEKTGKYFADDFVIDTLERKTYRNDY